MKKSTNIFSNVLIVIGIVFIGVSVFAMNQWRFVQNEPDVDLSTYNETFETDEQTEEPVDAKIDKDKIDIESYIGSVGRSDYRSGTMRITVPKLNVQAEVLDGTSIDLLKLGPGLYESSPLHDIDNPNICIAAHRTTYGAWFRNIDDLLPGEFIYLEYDDKLFRYEVEDVFIVEYNDWTITEQQDYSSLTLSACHPPNSADQRMIVRAKLVDIRKSTVQQ